MGGSPEESFDDHMREMMECFADEVGDRPTLGEALEIFALAAPARFDIPMRYRAVVHGKPYRARGRSRVTGLNDATFSAAAGALTTLASDDLHPDRPTFAAEVSGLLTAALRNSGIRFADITSMADLTITAVSPSNPRRPKLGDVLAIPLARGGYRIAVVVARNSDGTALGFFRSVASVPRIPAKSSPVLPHPIYGGEGAIRSGKWRVIGNDENLVALFPDPEIYHWPDARRKRLGAFGAAENSQGVIRAIGEDEARMIGLLDGTYEQFPSDDQMLQMVDRLDPR